MKKVILQAVVNPNYNKVMFNVTEQTHTGYAFGKGYSNKFRASNGIVLGSNKHPARDKDDNNTIWLRGSDAAKNGNTVVVGKKLWAKVVEAVKEYNRVNAVCAPPAPKADACAVIVG